MATKIVLHSSGFRELLRSRGMVRELERHVNAIKASAGEGYDGDVIQGKTRARGGVVTATGQAVRDNAKHNTLVKSVAVNRKR